MDESQKPLLIAVMGMTGVGKSEFINVVSGHTTMEVGEDQESCTQSIRYSVPFTVGGRSLQLVDTPGFGDTYKSDTDILQLLSTWLQESYGEAQTLAGILYLRPITQKRMDGNVVRNIALFSKLCGPQFLANTVLVTTMWDEVGVSDTVTAQKREGQLRCKFWSELIAAGSDCVRYARTRDSGEQIIGRIVGRQPEPEKRPVFVDELLAGKTLAETAAGAIVRYQLGEDVESLEAELEVSRRQLQDMGEQSTSLRALLEKAQRQTEAALLKVQADRQNLEKGSWEEFVFQGARFLSDTVWGGAKLLTGAYR